MALPLSVRRRGLIVLLVMTFFMFCGFFMVIPLVSVHYVDNLGFAAAVVGLALALRQLGQQGTTIFSGMLADRFGVRPLIAAGVLVRAVAFAGLAWAESVPLLFLAMILSALGGALFDAPSRAAVAALTTEENRARYYSLSGVVSGVAMTVGPLIGALLLRLNFQLVCLAAAACFALIFFITLFVLPPVPVALGGQSFSYGVSLVVRDRPFMLLTALLMGYWFMWVQITISLPLVARELTGSSDSVGVVFALNAGLTVVLQYPVLRLAERWLKPLPILILGVVLMALGLGAVAAAPTFAALLVCVVVFAIGVLLATPTQQAVTATLADPRALGSYLGVSSMALAFGGGLGNLAGGWLIDIAHQTGWSALPWLVFCGVGLAAAGGLTMLANSERRQPQPARS